MFAISGANNNEICSLQGRGEFYTLILAHSYVTLTRALFKFLQKLSE